MFNILRLTVAYLNATINVKPETQNRRLEPTGLAKPAKSRGLTGMGQCFTRQESAGQVFGRFWNWTDPFLQSKPGPLAGYPDTLLTLHFWLSYHPEEPCDCEGHNCWAIHSTVGHAAAVATTAKSLGIPLIVIVPLSPTPSKIDISNCHC